MQHPNLIILGPQGSGKGTQAKLLSEKFAIPHISTGEMFRTAIAAGTELGREAKEYLDAGNLVPDNVTIGLVKEALSSPKARQGFILDGFPRNLKQYQELRDFWSRQNRRDLVFIYIELSGDEAIARIAKRFICEKCEEIYIGNPGVCKKCGSDRLIQRTDETPDAVRKRLQIFNAETLPMVKELEKDGKLLRINGAPSIEEVHKEILEKLKL
jgi:adenylate kinase